MSACTGDNPRALARGLSPITGGQTVVLLLIFYFAGQTLRERTTLYLLLTYSPPQDTPPRDKDRPPQDKTFQDWNQMTTAPYRMKIL